MRAVLLLLAAIACVSNSVAQTAGRYGHYNVYDQDLLPRSEYAARRSDVLAGLPRSSAMLVTAAIPKVRSNDVDFSFRQRNNLLYLSGVDEPNSALLLVPAGIDLEGERVREILFVAERDPLMETWLGASMGPDVASNVTGIATVRPYSELHKTLEDILPSLRTIYYDSDWMDMADLSVAEPLLGDLVTIGGYITLNLKERFPSLTVKSAGTILDPMRVVKSAAEISLIRRAVFISMEAHRQTIQRAREGMYEYELEAIMEYEFQRLGSESPAYPSIVGSGPNSCVLHYETSRRRTAPGDMVVMDCGAEYHGYAADITRSMPISGRFTLEQRAIYDLVLQAMDSAIKECRVGNDFNDPHRTAVEVISSGLVRLGVIEEPDDYQRYFPHATSHYLGLDVHDVGQRGRLLERAVMTVEPGIYIPAGSPCDPKWWNIGVRIEDDILITQSGPENLSSALPRRADEIERMMAETQGAP